MKITVAIDSFKGSLTSLEAGNAARQGILRAMPEAQVSVRPLADGGEGTVEALIAGLGGTLETVEVCGPLGEPVLARYGILGGNTNAPADDPAEARRGIPETADAQNGTAKNNKTAVIEMAAAAGLTLIPPEKRSPLHATTAGVGQLIRDAISKSCRRFLIGIGGSATNDGGTGMLTALGYAFLDREGRPVPPGAAGLPRIASISDRNVMPELSECSFRIACDVDNPLCGPRGCSHIFGPQKGATPELVRQMDGWLQDFDRKVKETFPQADAGAPGAGAAGGLGYAFRTFTGASLEPGAGIILQETGLETLIRDSDLVVTGEGRLDSQTAMGKAPIAVARLAKKYRKPVIAFAGCVAPDAEILNSAGIDAFFPILRTVVSQEEALLTENARENLSAAACQAFRLLAVAGDKERF